MGGVLLILLIYSQVSHVVSLQLISLAALFSLTVDVLRRFSPQFNESVLKIMGPLMREYERNGFAGTTFLLFGVFTIIWVFPSTIVHLALLFLAVADPVASYVGIRYGKDKIFRSKSLQGTMAAFAVCTLITAVYCYSYNLMTDRILIVSLLAGLGGSASELIEIGKLDDNFTLPILAAGFIWIIFYMFGGL